MYSLSSKTLKFIVGFALLLVLTGGISYGQPPFPSIMQCHPRRALDILTKLEQRNRMPYWDEIDELVLCDDFDLPDSQVVRYFKVLRLEEGTWSYHLDGAEVPKLRSIVRKNYGDKLSPKFVIALFLAKMSADANQFRIAQNPEGLRELLKYANRLDAAFVPGISFQSNLIYLGIQKEMKANGAGPDDSVQRPLWGIDLEDAIAIFQREKVMKPGGPIAVLSEADVKSFLAHPGITLTAARVQSFAEQVRVILTVAAKAGYTGFNDAPADTLLFDRARLLLHTEDYGGMSDYEKQLGELETHLRELARKPN